MANCRQVNDFLTQLRARSVSVPLADPEIDGLAGLSLVSVVSAQQYQDLSQRVGGLGAAQANLVAEQGERAMLSRKLGDEVRREHSILFHLRGKEQQAANVSAEAQDRAKLAAEDAELTQREQAFNQLLAQRTQLDALTPVGGRYVGLTVPGALALRDLGVRLYRYADTDFGSYAAEMQHITQELGGIANIGAAYFAGLSASLPDADRAYLWAIGVGLAKVVPDASSGGPKFLDSYRAVAQFSPNVENRLMASEILTAIPTPSAEAAPMLGQLVDGFRHVGVPAESALGVGAIVLYGRRADGSFATESVRAFLRATRCYEAAALLGITNSPADALEQKFDGLRALFRGWGYENSEDTELAAAYLTVSEYAPEQVGSKLAIIARGMLAYLEYPLVAAAILSSIATLEANEALNLVEKAYGIVGRVASGLQQTELICLAVRMVHGIRNELVGSLDTTATPSPVPAPAYVPRPMFLPIIVAHGTYYSTFGGLGGIHPGHVHGLAGGFGGAGFG